MNTCTSSTSAPLRGIQQWVLARLGIHYPDHKLDVLQGRLESLCYRAKLTGLQELHDQVTSGVAPGLEMQLAHVVSTNHTGFFREPETFSRFVATVLPSFGRSEQVRIWSAASSTGEEAYTIAMLAYEHYGAAEALARCAVLGTDISHEVIQAAELGIYSDVSAIPVDHRAHYLTQADGGFRVAPHVARLCMFRRLNLMRESWPFRQKFHVIFCRNVLYYFEPAQQQSLLLRMYERAEPGAWLITSVTESLRSLDVPWKSIQPGFHRRVAP